MPIAYFLALAAVLLGSYFQGTVRDQRTTAIADAEASAVASNMVAYQRWLREIIRYKDPVSGTLPNYPTFLAYQGDGQAFALAAQANGTAPQASAMSWFKGSMPGVSAWIDNGRIYLQYRPTSAAMASERGVQSALRKLTGDSFSVGKAVLAQAGS